MGRQGQVCGMMQTANAMASLIPIIPVHMHVLRADWEWDHYSIILTIKHYHSTNLMFAGSIHRPAIKKATVNQINITRT